MLIKQSSKRPEGVARGVVRNARVREAEYLYEKLRLVYNIHFLESQKWFNRIEVSIYKKPFRDFETTRIRDIFSTARRTIFRAASRCKCVNSSLTQKRNMRFKRELLGFSKMRTPCNSPKLLIVERTLAIFSLSWSTPLVSPIPGVSIRRTIVSSSIMG